MKHWKTMRQTPATLPVTEAQRRELDRRLDELEAGQRDGIAWDELVEWIRKRSK